MGLWLALGAMTLLAVGLAVAPLVRRVGPAASRRDYDLRVYRAQLVEADDPALRDGLRVGLDDRPLFSANAASTVTVAAVELVCC